MKFDAELARDGSVDPIDKALYAALASFVDSEYRDTNPDPGGDDIPTRARLAECIGRSVDTVDRATKRLEARGLVRVDRRRDPFNPRQHLPSVYELLDYERWDERAAAR
ncbi:GntR family transcriptional regulator, partial [Microtetraspora sp. AC03309]|uniref:helix-turn-helix domain-containing protein n=1 Tax=Microtetraspora sp. AC03309 TaxID=2779376 RepID=UPI001E4FCF31